MACLLAIETSTKICSLALSLDKKLIVNKICTKNNTHASIIGVFTLETIKYANKNNLKINAIAVSAGPGSYTGLRIGLASAKGLCYGFNIPLIAIPTLKIMTFQAICNMSSNTISIPNSIYCPMIDIRKMEVFTALYDVNLNEIYSARASIIDKNSYKEYLKKYTIIFFGNGSDKCRNVIQASNAIFIKDIFPTTKSIVYLAESAFKKQEFANTIYFEPFYLKEFQTTIAQNKVSL